MSSYSKIEIVVSNQNKWSFLCDMMQIFVENKLKSFMTDISIKCTQVKEVYLCCSEGILVQSFSCFADVKLQFWKGSKYFATLMNKQFLYCWGVQFLVKNRSIRRDEPAHMIVKFSTWWIYFDDNCVFLLKYVCVLILSWMKVYDVCNVHFIFLSAIVLIHFFVDYATCYTTIV